VRKVAARRFKLPSRLSLIVRQRRVVWQLDPSAVGRKKYRARSVP
jgi:hypothetical protein